MSLLLNEFTIERFRGLRDLELKQLGRFNLLVGPNNSGKTSVLEALLLYCRPKDPLAWQGAAALRDGFVIQDRVPELLRWLFPLERRDARTPEGETYGPLCLRGDGAFPVRRVIAHATRVSRMASPSSSHAVGTGEDIVPVAPSSEVLYPSQRHGLQLDLAVSDATLEGSFVAPAVPRYTFWPDEPYQRHGPAHDPKLEVAFVSPYGHRIEQALAQKVKQRTLQETKSDVLQLMRLLDEDIEDLESLPGFGAEASLYVKLRGQGYLPLNGMGDGVRRALTLALSLLDAKDSILLVDELESALHVSALRRVFSWLLAACRRHDVQLFATTHSLEAVDAILAVDENPEEDVVAYRLERHGGQHQAIRFGEGELRLLRNELGQEIR